MNDPISGGRDAAAQEHSRREAAGIPDRLLSRIDELTEKKKFVIIAIDGHCAAGKSTLAAMLKSVYSCNVFSTDDFFLQPFQRTAERLAEPGGNFDRERFLDEVIQPLQTGNAFSYRAYNCQTQELTGAITVTPNALNIVEGVYSLHPQFTDAYDIKVFLRIGPDEQSRRLLDRNPKMYDKFINEWIPMENIYFNVFHISEECDFVFSGG